MLALAQQNGSAGMSLSDVMQTAVENQSGVYALCSTIFNFPTAFFPCITAAIIPAITACLTKNDEKGATLVQDSSLRLTGLIAMPCTIGLLVLSEPIMALLGHYGDSRVVKVRPLGYSESMIGANNMAGRDDMEIEINGNDERLLLTARFDNLGKGASGAAIQCMNIALGLDEVTGLTIGE